MPARSSCVAAQHRDDEARSVMEQNGNHPRSKAVPPNRLAESSDDDVINETGYRYGVRTYMYRITYIIAPPRGVGASINQYSTLPVSYL